MKSILEIQPGDVLITRNNQELLVNGVSIYETDWLDRSDGVVRQYRRVYLHGTNRDGQDEPSYEVGARNSVFKYVTDRETDPNDVVAVVQKSSGEGMNSKVVVPSG